MLPSVTVFGIEIGMYSVCAIVGFIFAIILFYILNRKNKNLNSVQKVNIPVVSAFGVFLGAHILYGITRIDRIWWVICHTDKLFEGWNSFIFYFTDIFGGMVFYGGLIGGLIAGGIYCKCLKLDTMTYADAFAPSIPLFHTFGRIGCFLGGCCYGIESKWGFVYHNSGLESANGVCRLPIQLIEAGGDIIICIILVILTYKNLRKGMIMYLYLFMYSILRFLTEFFRGDEIRGFLFGISTSQWISIIIFIVTVILIIRLYKNKINIKNIQKNY